MTHIETPTRTPSPESRDDTILPFEVAALDLRGRVVRLGAALDEILSRHDYPLPVAKLIGEAIALAALFGSALKFDGKFILQTQTDGPVRMLVVDYATSGNMRACARFDKKRVAAAIAAGETSSAQLLGHGHLAMTIDQGGDMSRYQGVVALEGSISGEHGIGFSKAPFLAIELSPDEIGLMKRIKAAFDPKGLLNPGKIFPES